MRRYEKPVTNEAGAVFHVPCPGQTCETCHGTQAGSCGFPPPGCKTWTVVTLGMTLKQHYCSSERSHLSSDKLPGSHSLGLSLAQGTHISISALVHSLSNGSHSHEAFSLHTLQYGLTGNWDLNLMLKKHVTNGRSFPKDFILDKFLFRLLKLLVCCSRWR